VEPQFALAATTSLLNVKTSVWYGMSEKGVAGEQRVYGRMAERDARHVLLIVRAALDWRMGRGLDFVRVK
jgi:hypothetical protein